MKLVAHPASRAGRQASDDEAAIAGKAKNAEGVGIEAPPGNPQKTEANRDDNLMTDFLLDTPTYRER